jgi:hypothetical protein
MALKPYSGREPSVPWPLLLPGVVSTTRGSFPFQRGFAQGKPEWSFLCHLKEAVSRPRFFYETQPCLFSP